MIGFRFRKPFFRLRRDRLWNVFLSKFTTGSMFFLARLAQYGQTEPFALCAVREKAIEGKCAG